MAAKTKQNGKKGSNNGAKRSTTKTSSAAKTSTKNKNSAKSTKATGKAERNPAPRRKETVSPETKRVRTTAILIGAIILLLAVVLIKGEHIWLAVHNFMFGAFGVCAFALPVTLIYLTVLYLMDKSMISIRNGLISVGAFVLVMSSIVHLASGAVDVGGISDQIEYIWSLRETVTPASGGVVGAVIGGALEALFGKVAAIIVSVVLLMISFVFMCGRLTQYAYVIVKERIDISKVNRDRKRAEQKAQREERMSQNAYTSVEPEIKKPKFTPIDIIPSGGPDDSSGFIEELVGNAVKAEPKPNKKEPKPFKTEEQPTAIDEIIRSVNAAENSESKKDEKPEKASDKQEEIKKTEQSEQKEEENSKSKFEPALPGEYIKPALDCLGLADNSSASDYEEELKANSTKLIDTLNSFGVSTKIVGICRGPSVTRYELQPAAGVKISKITGLSDDLALALASSGVRIEAPIPNKSAVGIEVPNKNRATVSLREIIDTPVFQNAKSKLNVALGKDITGNTVCADIAKMPHLLIAGTTGSGKSVCLNSMIVSILYNATPDEVKLLMIDPKQVEFTVYNGIPHLLVPVVSDPRKAAGALGWAVTEMLQRYKLFSERNVRDIKGYNRLAENSEDMQKMPQVVIFIDELSDLMMAAPNEVEDSICRLAQMARAAGMHLVIATQRPSVNVITGIIKANIPSRIALSVSSQVDSRTIIDVAGAEKLLGNGDMLFNPMGISKPVRVQGCFISDEEVEAVVGFIKNQGGENHDYDEEVMQEIERQAVMEKKKEEPVADDGDGGDEMIPKAIEVVVESQMASTTLLQRKLKLGYARAARIIDELEQRGIVGPFKGSKPREVLISKQQWMEMNALAGASAPVENPLVTEDSDSY
ncbi:MAG: DNA translocase FtsK [Clostridia bacterium]|nr:DNA translocase FtsK [Clostridia bacterium]